MKESKVNPEQYIVLQGWMVSELNLKGNELIVYACIHGFSQLEGQVFSGSLQYLADWTNSTRQGVVKCLKSLIEKGYIEKADKVINNVKFCEYRTTKFNGGCTTKFNGVYNSVVPAPCQTASWKEAERLPCKEQERDAGEAPRARRSSRHQ